MKWILSFVEERLEIELCAPFSFDAGLKKGLNIKQCCVYSTGDFN